MSRRRVSRKRIALIVVLLLGCGLGYGAFRVLAPLFRDPLAPAYDQNCAVCHGDEMQGTTLGLPLVGRQLTHGSSVPELAKSIAEGIPGGTMPGFTETLAPSQIQGLAILISERRSAYSRTDYKIEAPLEVPAGTLESEEHRFRVETVATDLHPWPFSIAPLPDGSILLTEKLRGMSIVSAEGQRSALIEGTPPTHDDGYSILSLVYGTGWLLDVAPHPDHAENGWIYLHFGDRCVDCETSMNKLIRGRIEEGRWVDAETIWSAAPEAYTETPDIAAGGRIAFDERGHVFLSIGIKGHSNYHGPQDLGLPYGKILRVRDDGAIPPDNPFVTTEGALPSIWSYGHRNPQGLEFDARTGRLWSTEMGPRGGDEFNLILPGRNYGWPLVSKGLDYDGTPVEYGIELGIVPDLDAIEQPVVDLTPAPAVSSFALYEGDAFPRWRHQALVGTLKARELYRFVLEGERVVHRETLLAGIGRIRDVETGPDGLVYLLLENAAGGRIVRLVPE
jgi:glucose/arabinose dehydrogenase